MKTPDFFVSSTANVWSDIPETLRYEIVNWNFTNFHVWPKVDSYYWNIAPMIITID